MIAKYQNVCVKRFDGGETVVSHEDMGRVGKEWVGKWTIDGKVLHSTCPDLELRGDAFLDQREACDEAFCRRNGFSFDAFFEAANVIESRRVMARVLAA